MVQTFADYKQKQLREIRPGYIQGLWRGLFGFRSFLRSDGVFLKITPHNSREEDAMFPLDLSISALRVPFISLYFSKSQKGMMLVRTMPTFLRTLVC